MKFLNYIIICCVLGCMSCTKNLDLYPHSAVSTDNLTEKDIEALLSGTYNRVQNAPGRESYIMFDLIGGNLINSSQTGAGNINVFINGILRPEQALMGNSWDGYFRAHYQVNSLLQGASKLPDSKRKSDILGVAHFFRGYIYYNLLTRWGGVPILRENTQEKLPRDSEAEVWAFIEEELETAIATVPGFSTGNKGDFYYVSKEAAQGLMARVKLAQGKKSEAAALAESLIQSGDFQLDAFSKIFRSQANREVIFAFKNLTAESSITLSTLFYTYSHPEKGSYVYKPTDEVMNLYATTDTRRAYSIDTYSGLNVINKYPSGQTGTDPVVIVRLAEMYLISAEAQGLAGLSRLNELRAARGLGAVNPSSEDQYLDLILEERRREFLAEGYYWYDLVRTGKAIQKLNLDPKQVKLPIPESELVLNELMEQNPNY
jgi:starch-binding outer membrane protein, SusD/RagB family